MSRPRNRRSLFAQGLDRTAFAAYFLGAIVPLAALAWRLHGRELQGPEALSWAAFLGAVAVLSLGAFLALRRTARESLGRMAEDQERLTALLEASGELDQRPDRESSAQALVHHACRVAQGEGAFLVESDGRGGWQVGAEIGVSEPEALLDEPLCESVARCCSGPAMAQELAGGGFLVASVRPDRSEPLGLVLVPRPGRAFDGRTREAVATLTGLASVALSNADMRHAQRNFFAHVTELLTTALDAHLGYHGGHGHRAAQLSNVLGHELRLPTERLQALHFAALLHDIGMLRMERDLGLPPSAWEPHARHGYELLKPIVFWESSAPIVLSHHERWDGTGYPSGLAGEDIPLEARILSVCDAFDAMTSESTYRERVDFEEALQELERCAGTQFDPSVVTAFRRLVEKGVIECESRRQPEGETVGV